MESEAALLDRTFAALSDATRRAILARLSEGEASVHQLSEPFVLSAPAISRHLRVLETAGLIRRRRDGKHRRCQVDPDGLRRAADWVDRYRRFWLGSLDRLDEHLRGTAPETECNP